MSKDTPPRLLGLASFTSLGGCTVGAPAAYIGVSSPDITEWIYKNSKCLGIQECSNVSPEPSPTETTEEPTEAQTTTAPEITAASEAD